MGFFIVWIVGVVVGIVITRIALRPQPVGTLRIDQSDPNESPSMFLEIYRGVGDMSKCKYVTFDVSTESYISQE